MFEYLDQWADRFISNSDNLTPACAALCQGVFFAFQDAVLLGRRFIPSDFSDFWSSKGTWQSPFRGAGMAAGKRPTRSDVAKPLTESGSQEATLQFQAPHLM